MEQKQFKLPESILNQLNEFSNGGFVLVRVGEGGNPPEIFMNADNPITMIGLVSFIQHWSESVSLLHGQSIFEGIVGSDDLDDEDND